MGDFMSMSQLSQLNHCFSKEITSVEQYEKTIKEIEDVLGKINNNEESIKLIKKVLAGMDHNKKDETLKSEIVERLGEISCNTNNDKYQFFYRGDVYCTKVQSNLFKNGCLPKESKNFTDYCKFNESKLLDADINTDFLKLAYMQHYGESTRLLDFTTDPLIALRFACGPKGKNNCPKKITIYAVKPDLTLGNVENTMLKILMEFVKSDSYGIDFSVIAKNAGVPESKVQEILLKDYFISPPTNPPFERINHQKGSFLFMGNRTDAQLLTEEISGSNINIDKVPHQLSPTFGRGMQYDGYVGVLTIAKESIPIIRNTLDCCPSYNINYLMGTIT